MGAARNTGHRVRLEPGAVPDAPSAQPEDVVGIGPIISGWHDNSPCYWFDQILASGLVERSIWLKKHRGADRPAKAAAIFERSQVTGELREKNCVIVTHDECSFDSLVQYVRHQSLAAIGRHRVRRQRA